MSDAPERIWAWGDRHYVEADPINHYSQEYIRADVHERLMENMRQIEANVQKVREHEHQRANKAEAAQNLQQLRDTEWDKAVEASARATEARTDVEIKRARLQAPGILGRSAEAIRALKRECE